MPCCSRCGRRVYAAEEKLALDRSWHLECYTCALCNRTLDSSNLAECKIRDEIYCFSCYRKYVGLQGYGFGATNPTLVVYNPLTFEKLPNDCPNNAETVDDYLPQDPRLIPPPPSRLGKSWISKTPIPLHYQNHSSLNPGDPCAPPPSSMDRDHEDSKSNSSSFCDDSYDSAKPDHYANVTETNYDPTDSEPIRVRSEDSRVQREAQKSPKRNRQTVYNAHRHSGTSSDEYQQSRKHRNQNQSPGRRNLNQTLSRGDIAPNPPVPPRNAALYNRTNSQSPIQRKMNNLERPTCRKCEQPVFHAEMQHGYRGAYHIDCFRCGSCSKQLNPGTVSEDQGELYCTACYRRNFGPH